MRAVSVVIPVKDGAARLAELLAAVNAQGPHEVLVIDSGSRDSSMEIAQAAGATVHEIPPHEFGHGRTRNLGAELTEGELICFLTQDAVPLEGWLDSYRAAFDLEDKVGAAYGPHLPWPDTTPMIARDQEDFFASMSPADIPVVHRAGDITFLSNVNACYLRRCWEEIRFPDVAYAEDQAFGAAMLEAGWAKVFHPGARVRHAHDYGPAGFARRFYDEYRGLRETVGYMEPLRPTRVAADLRSRVSADRRWMERRHWPPRRQAAWMARSLAHHASRTAAAGLATRVSRLPPALERRISLEGRATAVPAFRPPNPKEPEPPPGDIKGGGSAAPPYAHVLQVARVGMEALDDVAPGDSGRRRLHLAFVVPPFKRGGGGHSTIFTLLARLEGMGHTCTVWVHDASQTMHVDRPAVLRRNICDWFTPVAAPAFAGFDAWHGADVVVATGWSTVHPAATLPGCKARAYLVQDHEPEFEPTSAERDWAQQTYGMGFFPICAGHWLRDLVAERYGARGTWFGLGVDRSIYHPMPADRRRDTVMFYSRVSTERRATALGVLALEELLRRRPDTRTVIFGQQAPLATTFEYEALGVAPPGRLAAGYARATVGLCLSMTNYSLIPQEMMACGLPCVDLAGGSSEAMFGSDGPVELAEADPLAIAGAVENMLVDDELWHVRSAAGLKHVAEADWDRAARRVEAGLRAALAARE